VLIDFGFGTRAFFLTSFFTSFGSGLGNTGRLSIEVQLVGWIPSNLYGIPVRLLFLEGVV
jgi:hypothetical protein